jgi:hypothetical protein
MAKKAARTAADTTETAEAAGGTRTSATTDGEAERPRTNVYVDGFNLFYGALKGKGAGVKWLDLAAVCRRLLPENDVRRIRYFTARVSGRVDDQQLPDRQAAYLRALATLPEVSVHLGEFKVTHPRMARHDPDAPPGSRPDMVTVIKTEEKGSDVNIATYLILDACRRDCEVAVVVTNDSDLREPIRLARQELGLPVGVINPHPPVRRSRSLDAAFFRQLRGGVLTTCQFPDVLTDADGRRIRKPRDW